MSDSDLSELSFVAESAWGVVPDPAVAFQILRQTGESLEQETTSQESRELRQDRQVGEVKRTGIRATGGINFELSYGTFDSLIAAAVMGAWSGDQLNNGVTPTSFCIEREYTDLSNEFALYTGMMIDQFNLAVDAASLVTGSFQFVGHSEASDTATAADSKTAITTTGIMSAVEDVDSITEGGSGSTFNSFSMRVANNLRTRPQIASLGPASIGLGHLSITGRIQRYFTSKALINKYLNWTTSSLVLTFSDTAGNQLVLTLPGIKYTRGRRVAGGRDADILAELDFTAQVSSGTMIQFDRTAA